MQLRILAHLCAPSPIAMALLCGLFLVANWSLAQPPTAPAPALTAESSQPAAEELERLAAAAAANRAGGQSVAQPPRELNFLQLLMDGGPLMIPLILVSILVLTISLERMLNLRTSRILPRKLRRGLEEAVDQRYPVEPQELYQLGLRYPSVASRVLEAMLKKVGRPIPEMEAAIEDACQREADRLYGTVRWLTAAAAIAPLLGLLGTVWGMILAFFETTQPGMGLNRTQQLAQGISIAFVNTLGGLSIAIPAAGFSHYFEGRIIKLMNRVQEHVQALVPRMERFEGVTRFDLELNGLVQRRRAEPPPVSTAITTPAITAATESEAARSRDARVPGASPVTRQVRNR